MTNKEAINYLKQLYPNGGHCWLDEQRMEAIGMAINALQEEPVSEEQVKEDTMTIRKEWFEHCKKSWYNEGYIDGEYNRDRKFEKTVSEDLEEASKEWLRPQLDKSYANYGEGKMMELTHFDGYAMLDAIEFGAKWKAKNLWKSADSDDLPKIDREVIAILDNGKVVFAHRPSEHWDGKNIVTGKVTRYYPKTYGKGGWNIPNIKWWLDCSLPNMEED